MTETTDLLHRSQDVVRDAAASAQRLAKELNHNLDEAARNMGAELNRTVDHLGERLSDLRAETDARVERLTSRVNDLRDSESGVERLRSAFDELVDTVRRQAEQGRAEFESFRTDLDARVGGYAPVTRAELTELTERVEAAEKAAAKAVRRANAAEKAVKPSRKKTAPTADTGS